MSMKLFLVCNDENGRSMTICAHSYSACVKELLYHGLQPIELPDISIRYIGRAHYLINAGPIRPHWNSPIRPHWNKKATDILADPRHYNLTLPP